MAVTLYVPERTPIDPPLVSDQLSESLDNVYGTWAQAVGSAIPYLDGTKVLVGLHSIAFDNSQADDFTGVLLNLKAAQDMSNFVQFEFAVANAGPQGILSNSGSLTFNDATGGSATASFGIPNNNDWSFKQFTKASFVNGFQPLDWTRVTQWVWQFGFRTQGRAFLRIDSGPFYTLTVNPPKLSVIATDTSGTPIAGKSVQLSNAQGFSQTYALPFGPVEITPAGNFTLTILDSDFSAWSDGIASKSRTINLAYDGVYVLTARFTGSGPPPPPPGDIWPYVLGGGAVVVGGLGMLYYLKKRKRGKRK